MAQLQQGLAEYHATGGTLRQTMFLSMLAEAYGKIGQPAEGLAILVEALEAVERTGERFYEAELWRLQGELTLAKARGWGLGAGPSFQAPSLKPQVPMEVAGEAEAGLTKIISRSERELILFLFRFALRAKERAA